MGALKRLKEAKAKRGTSSALADPEWQRSYPELYELMTATVDEDGKARKPCSLTVFVGDGGVKACLNEKNVGLVMFATSATLDGLFGALEGRLGDEEPDWQVDRNFDPAAGKKGKK